MIKHLFALALASLPLTAHAATVPNIVGNTVVFGDSLSDAGFFNGLQITNGDVWASQVGLDFESGRNFAVAGATASSFGSGGSTFASQRARFNASTPRLPEYSQAVVWFGGNDLRLGLVDPLVDPVSAAFGAIAQMDFGIRELSATAGIDRFVVPGLPDLSQVPLTSGVPGASLLSTTFNSALAATVAQLNADGIDARFVDTAAPLAALLDDPNITNPTGQCQGLPSCEGFIFFDAFHPTEATHAIVAQQITAELAPVPLPMSGLMLGFGTLGLVFLRLKRKSAVAA